MRPFPSILLACLLIAPLHAGAQVYRWTDDRGAVVYGNHPPPGAARLARLDIGGALPGFPSAPGSRQKQAREFPGAALPAPSEFPGTVDRATVANAGRAIQIRNCASRPANCVPPEPLAELAQRPFTPLAALQVP
jgi:hypothetical protein